LLRVQLACEILLDILAGEGSRFYRTMYDAGLINQTFGCEVFCGRGYFANIFAGESKKPDEVFVKLKEEIRRLRQEGIPESDFSRAKKILVRPAGTQFQQRGDGGQYAGQLLFCRGWHLRQPANHRGYDQS